MGYSAKILADSVSSRGIRLTTMEVTFPRIVLAEFNTHRMLSRNSASSRAIPVEKMLQRVIDDPFLPVWWGKNQSGMQAQEELSDVGRLSPAGGPALPSERDLARHAWLRARDEAVDSVCDLQRIGLHKQIANRLLEPWLWHTVIVTATEWANFFALRCHKDAQPEIRVIAEMMQDIYAASTPTLLGEDEWHLPLVDADERAAWAEAENKGEVESRYAAKVSSGRCARVSYLTHDGKRDPAADVALADRLRASGHMSPLEHVARPSSSTDFFGNFRGWVQYRKMIPGEAVYGSSI